MTLQLSNVCVCMCVYVYICMPVCMRAHVRVCVCVCARARVYHVTGYGDSVSYRCGHTAHLPGRPACPGHGRTLEGQLQYKSLFLY